jgi:vacuolar-type H+-ATPase subunit F/Vma7
MSMARLCVVVKPDLADGFRLAGAETYPARSAALAGEVLRELLRAEDVGIVAVDADYYNALDERLRRQIDRTARPVVLAIPTGRSPELGERRARYVAELIQRAVGMRISIK